VACGSFDATVRVWDVEHPTELDVLRGHEKEIRKVALSSDRRRIVSGARDRTIRVWDVESGAELAVLQTKDNLVESLGFSADGRLILREGNGPSWSGEAWDAETFEKPNLSMVDIWSNRHKLSICNSLTSGDSFLHLHVHELDAGVRDGTRQDEELAWVPIIVDYQEVNYYLFTSGYLFCCLIGNELGLFQLEGKYSLVSGKALPERIPFDVPSAG
jgi:hypothetical protein